MSRLSSSLAGPTPERLQQLRRGDGAAAHQHFFTRTGFDAFFGGADQVTHADRTLAFEQHFVGQGVG